MQFTLELLNQFLEDMHEYSTVSAMAMGGGQEGQRVWQQWGGLWGGARGPVGVAAVGSVHFV